MRLEEIYEETLRVGPDRQELLNHIRAIKQNFVALSGRLDYTLYSNELKKEPTLERQIQEIRDAVDALASQFDQHVQFAHIPNNADTSRDRVRKAIG